MEITFEDIKRSYLTYIKDNRTLIKWLEKEGVEYFKNPYRCFKEEFEYALQQKQISDVKQQNPLDHAGRIERLQTMENKNLPTAPAISINTSPAVKQVLNPVFKKQEKLLPLKLGKKDAVPGLVIFCKHRDCKSKKKAGCKHPADYECYKLLIKTKTIRASFLQEFNNIRDEQEAKALARELRKITFLSGGKQKSIMIDEPDAVRNINFLPNLIEDYLEHLLKIKGNQEPFLKSQRKMFDVMLQVFTDNGADPNKIRIDQLNQRLDDGYTWVRKIELELDKREGKKKGKPIATTTKNNYIKLYRSIYKFACDNRDINIKNPFKTIKVVNVKQAIKNKIKTVTPTELSRLFEMLRNRTELNKKKTYFNEKKNKHVTQTFKYFQPYLLDGIQLAIAFGYRSENIVYVKWSDIDLTEAYSENSILNAVIKVEDIKVNNQKKQFRDDIKKFIYVRVNNDIEALLMRLGYQQYRETNAFILAPDHHHQRKTIKCNISKGFHHYMLEITPLKDLQFKDLRKTQLSHEGKNTSPELASRRVHGDFSTTYNNYFDDSILLPTAEENPTVFKGISLLSL